MINALTWMSHAQNLRRMSKDYVIDLYLQPPVTRFRLMDFHLMDRIVRNASRCRFNYALHAASDLRFLTWHESEHGNLGLSTLMVAYEDGTFDQSLIGRLWKH